MESTTKYKHWSKEVEKYLKGASSSSLDVRLEVGTELHPVSFPEGSNAIYPIPWKSSPMQIMGFAMSAALSDLNVRLKWLLNLGVDRIVLDLKSHQNLDLQLVLNGVHLQMIDFEILNATPQHIQMMEKVLDLELERFYKSHNLFFEKGQVTEVGQFYMKAYERKNFDELIAFLLKLNNRTDNFRFIIQLPALDHVLEFVLYARVVKLLYFKFCPNLCIDQIDLLQRIDLDSDDLSQNIKWTAELSAGYLSSLDGILYSDQLDHLNIEDWKRCTHTALNNMNILALESEMQRLIDPLSGSYWVEAACAKIMMELLS